MNTLLRIRLVFISCALLLLTAGRPAYAEETTALFILDVSGSMAQNMGDSTKMSAAKQTFSSLIDELPADLNVGLELYGHYGEKDCSAIEVVTHPQPLDATSIKEKVASLNPSMGSTPIADSLATAGEVLKEVSGAKSIILISDGEETCGGDPADVAARLHKEVKDLTISVIGFGVNDAGRKQLQAVAMAGGGRYYDAQDAAGLMASLREVKKQMVSTVIYRDDFNGEEVNAKWETLNPNPDTAIVEDGALQIISELSPKNIFEPNNLVLYKDDLPKFYEVVLHLTHTAFDFPYYWNESQITGIILHQDVNNGVMLAVSTVGEYNKRLAVHFEKVRDNKWVPGFMANIGTPLEDRDVTLKLQRVDRTFTAFYLNDKGEWVKVGEFSELRPKYRLGVFATRGVGNAREALQKFDWVEIRKLEK